VLQISSYWRPGDRVGIDFLPDHDAPAWLLSEKRARPKATIKSTLDRVLSARLAEALADKLALQGNLADQSDLKLAEAGALLDCWPFVPNGSEGYAKAEVTLGGISTDGLSQQTMEAKKMPGLFCIGEAVDVTGWLGGYNFQWAWASGVAAGEAV
jgi:predicted Rossmann fold flavoprotein